MRKAAEKEGWLQPQAVYGYWPCQSVGDELLVYDPETLQDTEPVVIERFAFPRQEGGEGLSLTDYFASKETGKMDVVAFRSSRWGRTPRNALRNWKLQGNMPRAITCTGWQSRWRKPQRITCMNTSAGSWAWNPTGVSAIPGLPCDPELEDHVKVFELLPAESALGMTLTSAYQLVPEQSTAAIIVHHPDAKYFNVGTSRVEQLLGD